MKTKLLLPLLLLAASINLMADPYNNPKEGDLIQAGDAVFIICDGKRCGIPSSDVFKANGFKAGNVIKITEEEMEAIPEGPIFVAPAKPYKTPQEGDLIQAGGPVFVIRNDVRHAIPNMRVFNANGFKTDRIIKISEEDMEAILAGESLK